MNITRKQRPVTEYCVIDLEIDFPTRAEAIQHLYIHHLFEHSKVVNELYNADKPYLQFHFTVNGQHTILGISLT